MKNKLSPIGWITIPILLMVVLGCSAQDQTNPKSSTQLRDCVIYVPNGAPPSNLKAATELQIHLKEIIGSELKIVHEPSHPMIAIGDSPEARAVGIQAKTLPYEGFVLRGIGGDLYFVGRDIPGDGPTDTDGKSLGTLYGTYEFLERVLGVRWFYPGAQGTYFPPKNPQLEIVGLNIEFTPRFKYRNFYVQAGNGKDSDDYNQRTRCRDSQIKMQSTDHGWIEMFPQPNSPEGKVVEDRMATYQKHPDWFEMSRNGQRVAPSAEPFYLCLSQSSLPEEVADRLGKLFQADPSRHIWCIGPNDGGPICYCPECEKRLYIMTPEEMGPTGIGNYRQTWTPLVLDFYRKTAAIVRSKNPEILLNGLCYQRYEFPPRDKPEPISDNFLAGMAPQHTGYGPIRLYDPINENWERWIKSWRGVFKRQVYYGLDFWIRQYAGAVMSPYPDIMKKTFSVLLEEGYEGAYFYSNPIGSNGAYCWVMTQMLWKPDGDPQKLLEEFCDKAYGSGGGSVIELHQLFEKNMKALITRVKGKVGHNMTPEMLKEIFGASWPEYEKLFLAAKSGATTEDQKWRLSHLEHNLKLVYYHLTRLGMMKEQPGSPLHTSSAEYRILVGAGYPGEWLRGLIDSPAEATDFTRSWRPLVAEAVAVLPNVEPRTETWYTSKREFVCLAEQDGEAAIQLNYKTDPDKVTGQSYLSEVGYYHVFNQKGERIVTDIGENGRLAFPAKKGSIYCVAYMPLEGKGSNSRWSIAKAERVRYAIGYRNDKRGVYIFDSGQPATPLYFHVPEGVQKFTIYINGSMDTELFDPTGKSCGRTHGYAALAIDRSQPTSPSGWWKIKPFSNGSGFIQQGPELSGYFVDDPLKALKVEFGNK